MANTNILLVDDDQSVLRLLESALLKNSYNVFKAVSGEEAMRLLENKDINIILLDVVLPGMDGLELLKTIRNHPMQKHIPVIMLTSRTSEIDNVLGLELGADDYIGKPIRYHELLARIKAVLRRTGSGTTAPGNRIILGNLIIDSVTRTIILNEKALPLSYTEYELFSLLAKRPGKVFTREEILNAIWCEDCYLGTRTIDVHIRRIRRKLEETAQSDIVIETVRNVGYRLISKR